MDINIKWIIEITGSNEFKSGFMNNKYIKILSRIKVHF